MRDQYEHKLKLGRIGLKIKVLKWIESLKMDKV